MKLLSILFAFATTVLAQNVQIYSPGNGSTISTGKQNVTILQANPVNSSTEIGIAIALHVCNDNPENQCDTTGTNLGYIVYSGSFLPTYQTGVLDGQPYENITIDIPSDYSGDAVLTVVHASLVGEPGWTPFMEFHNNLVSIS